MLKMTLCVALLICDLRLQLQGLCIYALFADAYSTASRQTVTHPSAAYPSQDFAENITLSTHLNVLTHWRRELQSDCWPSKRKLEPGGHDA